MSEAHVHSPVDQAESPRLAASTTHDHPDAVSACDGTRLTPTLDDLYKDTGLPVG